MPARKEVTFDMQVCKRKMFSRWSLTPLERDSVWVSRQEISQTKRIASETISLLLSGKISMDTSEHCILGLEGHTAFGRDELKRLGKGSIKAVLDDQKELQQSMTLGLIDASERDSILAAIYDDYSQQAVEQAQLRAMQTAFDVEEVDSRIDNANPSSSSLNDSKVAFLDHVSSQIGDSVGAFDVLYNMNYTS